MKNKMFLMGFTVFLVGVGSFFLTGSFRSLASELIDYDLEQAIEEGYVIQQGDEILNLIRFQEFFENVNRGDEDSVVVLVNPTSRDSKIYELHYREGSLLLYYDIGQNAQGRKTYRIKQYDSMTRMLRRNQIEFVLLSENSEDSFLSYSLTN